MSFESNSKRKTREIRGTLFGGTVKRLALRVSFHAAQSPASPCRRACLVDSGRGLCLYGHPCRRPRDLAKLRPCDLNLINGHTTLRS